MKWLLCTSCLLGVLFITSCTPEPRTPVGGRTTAPAPTVTPMAPTGPPASPMPSPEMSGSPQAQAPTGAPSPVAVQPSGPPSVAVHPSGPPVASPVVEKAEARPKSFPETVTQDPGGVVRIWVLDDGSVKPGSLSANTGKPLNIAVNNYKTSDVSVTVSGEGAPPAGKAGAGQKVVFNFMPHAGSYKVTVGSTTVPLTVK